MYSCEYLQAVSKAVYTKFLQQQGPACLDISSMTFDTTNIVFEVSVSFGQAAPKITLYTLPIAGAMPQIPVSPQ